MLCGSGSVALPHTDMFAKNRKKRELSIALLPEALQRLGDCMRGQLVLPHDPEYCVLRTSWNLDTLACPSAIALVADASDVQMIIRTVSGLDSPKICVSCGRMGNFCMVQDALVIDLRRLNQVIVASDLKSVEVEGGVCVGRITEELSKHGVAFPLGHNPHIGIGGLALTAGVGYLTRMHGFTIDCLLEAQVVLANGSLVVASESENSDLFWALRGGGGNFGIVTRFKFKIFPIPSKIYSGEAIYLPYVQTPLKSARKVSEYLRQMPQEVSGQMIFVNSGPLVVQFAFIGDPEQGKLAIDQAVSSFGWTALKFFKSCEFHRGLEKLCNGPKGDRQRPGKFYGRILIFRDISSEIINLLWEESHSNACRGVIVVQAIEGKINRIDPEATAFSSRDARFWVIVIGEWNKEREKARVVAWVKRVIDRVSPHAIQSRIEMAHEDSFTRHQFSASSWERLRSLKTQFDPLNLFSLNENIPPREL